MVKTDYSTAFYPQSLRRFTFCELAKEPGTLKEYRLTLFSVAHGKDVLKQEHTTLDTADFEMACNLAAAWTKTYAGDIVCDALRDYGCENCNTETDVGAFLELGYTPGDGMLKPLLRCGCCTDVL